MPGFSAQIGINAAPGEVFQFMSQTANMPRFLPTLEKANRTADGGMRLKGAANGHRYEFEGRFHIDDEALRLSWESLGPRRYQGACRVFETDEGAELACNIEIEPQFQGVAEPAPTGAADADFVTAALDDILLAVKQAIESRPRPAAG